MLDTQYPCRFGHGKVAGKIIRAIAIRQNAIRRALDDRQASILLIVLMRAGWLVQPADKPIMGSGIVSFQPWSL